MPLLIFHFHQAKYHQSAQTILTLCGFINCMSHMVETSENF